MPTQGDALGYERIGLSGRSLSEKVNCDIIAKPKTTEVALAAASVFHAPPTTPKKMVSIRLINKNVNIGNGMCGKNVNFAAIFKFEV